MLVGSIFAASVPDQGDVSGGGQPDTGQGGVKNKSGSPVRVVEFDISMARAMSKTGRIGRSGSGRQGGVVEKWGPRCFL